MPPKKKQPIKEALIAQAFSIIEDKGVEQLSLREVARRLGVSHQAPYKHFPSRDHILAAVVEKCFAEFAQHLSSRQRSEDPFEDLHQMGLAYLAFAKENPLKYRLMFNAPLPDGDAHPEMLVQARFAFSILHDRLDTMEMGMPDEPVPDAVRHDAIYIWSALHGLASLMQSDVTGTLDLSPKDKEIAVQRLMQRLSLSISP